jgi:coenzyme F420-0:L-glutamate ligase / coenzyme F420-1:gamma-L-glutamate ligase
LKAFTAFALEGIPFVETGDDLAKTILGAMKKEGLRIENGDVVVAAQKIFSKAEGRIVDVNKIVPSDRAMEISKTTGKDPRFVEIVLRESKKIIKSSEDILLVEDNRGLVCINSGIDKSNIEGRDRFGLLPEDPDRSAEKLRSDINKLTGKQVAVIMCDTYSRPFRRGQMNFAIGMAGINPFRDYRGKKDLFGQILRVKNIAVADELAAAAELLMGQGEEGLPVVILRGMSNLTVECDKCSTKQLLISADEDLFKNAL